VHYRLLYGDGIQRRAGQPQTTTVQHLSPGILFGLGGSWTLDYTPTWTFYSNRAFNDTVDHVVRLGGGTEYQDWVFGFSQSFVSASPPLVETGGQTKQITYGTGLSARRSLGSRTALELSFSQNIRFADRYPDTRQWSNQDWLHYEFSPQLDTAVGLGLGYVDVSPGPDMSYVRPQAQVAWRATDKVSFSLQGGVETRRIHASGAGSMNNPILSASLHYQPVETTTLSLGAHRGVSTSYFSNQVTKNSGWNASLQQRLLGEFFFSAGYGHHKVTYISTTSGFPAGRGDTYDSANFRLSTTFLRHGSIAVLYQIGRNSSNTAGYGFSSHQIGLDVGYRF
jgi:hypothetical protein